MTKAAEIQHLQQHGLYRPQQRTRRLRPGVLWPISKGVKRHDIVTGALKILENLDHRGAVGADKLMGDGAGILIQIPDAALPRRDGQAGVELPPLANTAWA